MNVVLTNLLCKKKDPARRTFMSSDPSMFAALRASVHAHGHKLIVFHDSLYLDDDELTTYCRVLKGGNPYFQRWRNIAKWLTYASNDAELVWCVDATDVVMLNDPFPHMQSGAFYSGSEPRRLIGETDHHEWLFRHHPSRRQFFIDHPTLPFMNPGIIGGNVAGVLAAATALGAEPDREMTDMGAWQQICHDLFDGKVITGHPVHTEYRALDHTNREAWWAHK